MNQNQSSNIEAAHRLIQSAIHRTPVLKSASLNTIFGCDLYFKCENLQKIGAFKMRGASHFIQKLLLQTNQPNELKVVTHSSGNHAQAVALAAKQNGIKAFIVMPSNAPMVKVKGVESYEGEIIFCEPTLAARESTMNEIRERENAIFIPPYDHEDIILGQATAAKEFIEEESELDFLLAPVGGGGLLAGTAISAKAFSPKTSVIGCEPVLANDAYQSFKSKKWVPSVDPLTIADGLKTSLGTINFNIILEQVDDLLTCSEASILIAMQHIWERMKLVVEPSAAVPLACLLENPVRFKGKKVGIILSGGNVDVQDFFNHLKSQVVS